MLLAGAGARADDRSAEKLFSAGNERYARGDYEGAAQAFEAAVAADPKLPGPYRNLGLAYRALNRCRDAIAMYEKYLALRPESRFTARVRGEIELCRQKLGQPSPPAGTGTGTTTGTTTRPAAQGLLHVAANFPGGEVTDEATVAIDGLVRGATPLTLPVVAGPHLVRLTRPGWRAVEEKVDVTPGARRDLEVTLERAPAATPAVAVAAPPAPPRRSLRKVGWALAASSLAVLAAGAGLGIAASGMNRDAVAADPMMTPPPAAGVYADVAYAAFAVGGAALFAAGVIFIVDPARGETHRKQRYE